jgi:hypothetical protein
MCRCREKTNEKLAEYNAQIAVGFTASFEDGPVRKMGLAPPMIETEKLDKKKRGRPPILMASYCPFCGTKYDD